MARPFEPFTCVCQADSHKDLILSSLSFILTVVMYMITARFKDKDITAFFSQVHKGNPLFLRSS